MYKKSKISIDVALASHTQKLPQVGLPHKPPVTNAKRVKMPPIGAAHFITQKDNFIRQINPMAPAIAIKK